MKFVPSSPTLTMVKLVGIYVLKLVVCSVNYILFSNVVIKDLLVKIEYYNLESNKRRSRGYLVWIKFEYIAQTVHSV